MKIGLIKNCYYCPINLICLLAMSHSDFSKCHMISTIEAWTMVLEIKLVSFYKKLLEIIILLFPPLKILILIYVLPTICRHISLKYIMTESPTLKIYLSLINFNHLSHHMSMYRLSLHHHHFKICWRKCFASKIKNITININLLGILWFTISVPTLRY